MPQKPVKEVSDKQLEVVDFIIDYLQRHGSQPSRQEIGTALGITSPAVTHRLRLLEEKGLISRPKSPRGDRNVRLIGFECSVVLRPEGEGSPEEAGTGKRCLDKQRLREARQEALRRVREGEVASVGVEEPEENGQKLCRLSEEEQEEVRKKIMETASKNYKKMLEEAKQQGGQS